MASAVSDVIHVMNKMAPPALAEEWDNIGLQVGDPSWAAKRIWIALDPTLDVVDAACRRDVSLLITHHPLIFKSLKSINLHTPLGKIIDLATRNHLAIFAAHTNLDSAVGGINDILADRIGIRELQPLAAVEGPKHYTVVIYASPAAEQKIRQLLAQSRTGRSRPDSAPTFYRTGNRPFVMPAKQISGDSNTGSLWQTDRIRIEIEVIDGEREELIEVLAGYQADGQIEFAVYPLITSDRRSGIGRIGSLKQAMDLKSFALMIKKKLKLDFLKLVGDPTLRIEKAAICSGSGSSLIGKFLNSGAQVYISGDLRYHDARDVQAANRGIVDIGHFPSEHIIVDTLAQRLKDRLRRSELDIEVDTCSLEKDPFTVL